MDLRKLLAVAIQRLESLATDLLKYDNLLRLGVVIHDGRLDDGSFHIRSSDGHGARLVEEEHLVELDRLTVASRETVHKDVHSSFNLELLACNVYDCVHYQ